MNLQIGWFVMIEYGLEYAMKITRQGCVTIDSIVVGFVGFAVAATATATSFTTISARC